MIESSSTDDAVEKAKSHEDLIRLVLTDVVMPGMNGPEVYARIHELHPEARVLYMSGYVDSAVTRRGLPAENTEFLQKPFSVHELLAAVGKALDL